MAATKVLPTGLTEAEKLPVELPVVALPPKLKIDNVVGSTPVGSVSVPLTFVGPTVVNGKLYGEPRGLSATFRTNAPIVTVYVAPGVSRPDGVSVTIIAVESTATVAGNIARALARVKLLGPTVAGSNGSLNVM